MTPVNPLWGLAFLLGVTLLDSIKAQEQDISVGGAINTALLWLVSVPFFLLGWLVGVIVRALVWIAAAFVAGYKAGRGVTDGTTG